jgi:hypothetical protein
MTRRLVFGSLVLFAGGLIMFGFLERKMTYYPTRALETTPSAVGLDYEDVGIRTADGVRIHGWFVPCSDSRTTLLFFHGNAGNIGDRVENLKLLHDLGLNVLIVDYRGYGRSEGSPREEGLYRDADAAFSYLRSRQGVDPARIAVFGRSLGGAVAVDLCSRVDCWRLVLEGAFTSAADMAREIFPLLPLGHLLTERFASIEKISRVRAPLLQFHGTLDEVIPMELGWRLFRAAGEPKEFVPVPGAGHNDVWTVGGKEYGEKIQAFLSEPDEP